MAFFGSVLSHLAVKGTSAENSEVKFEIQLRSLALRLGPSQYLKNAKKNKL